jgi:Zn-dependent peptidase ImmA (M78 family)
LIDSRLQPHYESFKQKGIDNGVSVRNDNLVLIVKQDLYRYENLYGKMVRETGIFTDKQVTVYIASEVFERNDKFIETVVYHELGHALLDRRHENSYPSLMNTGTMYLGYRNALGHYSKELEIKLTEELFKPYKK